jgi:peptidoglycan/LPS O-acetylase OafA/YrhL
MATVQKIVGARGKNGSAVQKFAAIEGMRGWLAWAVVLAHLLTISGLYLNGFGPRLADLGGDSVLLFIVISGFVITHLVVGKREPYGAYLIRRFMRIFPLFAITCVVGFFTNDILANAMARASWAHERTFANTLSLYIGIASSNHAYLWQHILAHITMLHGAISTAVLPYSGYALNSPAWSLSLEWQFYLIAPFVIAVALGRKGIVWLASAFALLGIAYNLGWLGSFNSLSLLAGASAWFALGIASRLLYPVIFGRVRHPAIILAICIALIPFGSDVAKILAWVLVMTGLALDSSERETGWFSWLYGRALESGTATHFGSRSYSTYLCHFPILSICFSLWLDMFPASSSAATFFGVFAMSVPIILVASEFLYRFVERPGIALGSLLAQRINMRNPHRVAIPTPVIAPPG